MKKYNSKKVDTNKKKYIISNIKIEVIAPIEIESQMELEKKIEEQKEQIKLHYYSTNYKIDNVKKRSFFDLLLLYLRSIKI